MKLNGDEDVNVSYKYMMNEMSDFAIQNNILVEDSAYEWAPKRWSYCSKSCGGGTVQQGKYFAGRKSENEMKFFMSFYCREAVSAVWLQKKSWQ